MTERFLRCRSGTSAIEYSLIAALISIIIIAVLMSIGNRLSVLFS